MSAAAIEDSLPPKSNNNDQRRENEEMSTSSTASAIPAAVGTGAGDSSSSPNSFPPSLEQHCRLLEEENHNLKESDARLQQQYVDSQRRERILMRRLATKEQEIQDYVSQISEYKSAQAPGPAALRSALLDPAVNILFEKLKQELQSTKAKLEETQNELSAWKFTPDSNTGKRLMAKCRLLYQENEELGKMTSNGRLAKLEGELAMQKSFSEEVKKSQSELDDFLQELDEDVEGMQSTILFLQQELKAAKDNITVLEKENYQLKTGGGGCYDMSKSSLMLNGKDTSPHLKNENELSECYDSEERTSKINLNNYNNLNLNSNSLIAAEDLRTNNSNSKFFNGKELSATRNSSEDDAAPNDTITNSSIECTSSSSCSNINNNNNLNINNGNNNNNNNNVSSNSNNNNSNTNNNSNKVVRQNQRKRNYDSDSSEENTSANGRTLRNTTNAKKMKKKTRRSSVLSIDLNEEDTQIADESDEEDSSNHRITTRRKSARNLQNGDNN